MVKYFRDNILISKIAFTRILVKFLEKGHHCARDNSQTFSWHAYIECKCVWEDTCVSKKWLAPVRGLKCGTRGLEITCGVADPSVCIIYNRTSVMCAWIITIFAGNHDLGRSILKGWSFSSVRCQIYAISRIRIKRLYYQQFFSRFSSGIMTGSIAKVRTLNYSNFEFFMAI